MRRTLSPTRPQATLGGLRTSPSTRAASPNLADFRRLTYERAFTALLVAGEPQSERASRANNERALKIEKLATQLAKLAMQNRKMASSEVMSTACKRLIVFSDAAATFSRANNGAFLHRRKKSGVRKNASSTAHSASGQRPSQSAARCPRNDCKNRPDDDAAVLTILVVDCRKDAQRTRACNARAGNDRRRFAARRYADRRCRFRRARVRDLRSARAHERADRA